MRTYQLQPKVAKLCGVGGLLYAQCYSAAPASCALAPLRTPKQWGGPSVVRVAPQGMRPVWPVYRLVQWA